MKFRLIVGVGFLVFAVFVFFIGDAGFSFGALAFVLVLLILGVALILSAYFQPSLSEKRARVASMVEPFFAAFI
jgi:hypothetical protein